MSAALTRDIARNIDNARRYHRSAIWFARQAKDGWREAAAHAEKLKREAWEFLAEARRIKAGEMERAA